MTLKLLEKTALAWFGRRLAGGVAGLACLLAAACVTSTDFVLGDSRAILGERGQIHIFSAPKGGMRDVQRHNFQWQRDRYMTAPPGGGGSEFTVHAFEGRNLVIQWKGAELWSPKRKLAVRQVHYLLARKVADGAYLLFPITENDVDEAARQRFCTRSPETPCRISTPEQLFVFARAAAEKDEEDAGIAIIVRQQPPAKKR